MYQLISIQVSDLKSLLIGDDLHVVVGIGKSKGLSGSAANCDLLHIVLGAAVLAGTRGVKNLAAFTIARILILLDLEAVCSVRWTANEGRRERTENPSSSEGTIISNIHGIEVGIGSTWELEGTASGLKYPFAQNIHTAAAHGCTVGHCRDDNCRHGQHKEHCYLSNSLTP